MTRRLGHWTHRASRQWWRNWVSVWWAIGKAANNQGVNNG